MTNQELQEKLTLLQTKLSKANELNDTKLIKKYVEQLNNLWDEASIEMLKNAEKDGVYKPDNPQ